MINELTVMKILTSLIFIISTFFLVVPKASACECDPPPPQKLFKQATAVFVGEVTEVSESTAPLYKGYPALSYAVKFKVVKYWKGIRGDEVIVHSDLGGLECHQFKFQKGSTYLVYAFGRNLTAITGCTRSGSISEAYVTEQIKQFGKGKTPKSTEAENRKK
jgi:hypothetical protein